MHRVTIIADASYCSESKAGGYGCWVVSPLGNGAFKGPLLTAECNNTAEIMAVANALWHGLKSGIISQRSQVLIQSDSTHAINLFEGLFPVSNENQKKALDYVRKLEKSHRLKIKFRHIKGHTKFRNSASEAQRRADKDAREEMRKVRSLCHFRTFKKSIQETRNGKTVQSNKSL